MSRGGNTESGGAQGARGATKAAPDSARRGKGRWSARRKVTVVLELIHGAELEATSRKYAVTGATLTSWRDAFLQGGENGLTSRTGEVADEHVKDWLAPRPTAPSGEARIRRDERLRSRRIR